MADAPTLDKKIDSVATLAQDLEKNPPSWIWKALGGLALAFVMGWIKWELNKKDDELAAAKNELEQMKLKAQQAQVNSQVESLENQRAELVKKAADAAAAVTAAEADLASAQKVHADRVAKVQAIHDGDWDALNKLAGVA